MSAVSHNGLIEQVMMGTNIRVKLLMLPLQYLRLLLLECRMVCVLPNVHLGGLWNSRTIVCSDGNVLE